MDSVKLLKFYEETWTSFINASLTMSDRYKDILPKKNNEESRLIPAGYRDPQQVPDDAQETSPILEVDLEDFGRMLGKNLDRHKSLEILILHARREHSLDPERRDEMYSRRRGWSTGEYVEGPECHRDLLS